MTTRLAQVFTLLECTSQDVDPDGASVTVGLDVQFIVASPMLSTEHFTVLSASERFMAISQPPCNLPFNNIFRFRRYSAMKGQLKCNKCMK